MGVGCAQVLQQCSPVQHCCGWWLQPQAARSRGSLQAELSVECPCVPLDLLAFLGRAVAALGAAETRSGAAQGVSTHPSVGCAGAWAGLGASKGIRDTSVSPGGLQALEEVLGKAERTLVCVAFPTPSTLLRYSDSFRVVEMFLSWNSSLRAAAAIGAPK